MSEPSADDFEEGDWVIGNSVKTGAEYRGEIREFVDSRGIQCVRLAGYDTFIRRDSLRRRPPAPASVKVFGHAMELSRVHADKPKSWQFDSWSLSFGRWFASIERSVHHGGVSWDLHAYYEPIRAHAVCPVRPSRTVEEAALEIEQCIRDIVIGFVAKFDDASKRELVKAAGIGLEHFPSLPPDEHDDEVTPLL